MTFSVVVPAHNEEKFIGKCLTSIRSAERFSESEVEIIVVLNRCNDRTEEIALSFGAKIVFEEAKNISKIRNAGAKIAGGDVLVTIDADSWMTSNTFFEIKRLLGTKKYIGGGSRIRPERVSLGILMSLLSLVPYVIVGGVPVGLFWCYRKDFESLGGFDEALISAEDLDLGQRLKKLGRASGLCYGKLAKAHIKTSCRKFDKFGDWYLFLNPRLVRQVFKGTDRKASDSFYYDVER